MPILFRALSFITCYTKTHMQNLEKAPLAVDLAVMQWHRPVTTRDGSRRVRIHSNRAWRSCLHQVFYDSPRACRILGTAPGSYLLHVLPCKCNIFLRGSYLSWCDDGNVKWEAEWIAKVMNNTGNTYGWSEFCTIFTSQPIHPPTPPLAFTI